MTRLIYQSAMKNCYVNTQNTDTGDNSRHRLNSNYRHGSGIAINCLFIYLNEFFVLLFDLSFTGCGIVFDILCVTREREAGCSFSFEQGSFNAVEPCHILFSYFVLIYLLNCHPWATCSWPAVSFSETQPKNAMTT